MKTILLLVAILFMIPSQAFAWQSICDVGEKILHQTNFECEKYFNDDIKDDLLSVKGIVRNVYPKSNRTLLYGVMIDCGNDILTIVSTDSSSVEDLKLGDETEFSCRFNKYNREYYPNSDKVFVKFWCLE